VVFFTRAARKKSEKPVSPGPAENHWLLALLGVDWAAAARLAGAERNFLKAD
jgi:hypothetical protein